MNSPHKVPVTRKRFPSDDVIMTCPGPLHGWYQQVWVACMNKLSDPNLSNQLKSYASESSWQIMSYLYQCTNGDMMTSSSGNILCVTDLFAGNSPHKGQWRGALMFSLICAWINDWVNNREACNLRRHGAHYDVFVMIFHKIKSKFSPSCHWNRPIYQPRYIAHRQSGLKKWIFSYNAVNLCL